MRIHRFGCIWRQEDGIDNLIVETDELPGEFSCVQVVEQDVLVCMYGNNRRYRRQVAAGVLLVTMVTMKRVDTD